MTITALGGPTSPMNSLTISAATPIAWVARDLGGMSKEKFTFGKLFGMLKETASDWMEDNALRLSAALAYYSIFSIAPLMVIAIAIAGWVLGNEAAQGILNDQLKGLLGAQAANGVSEMVKNASKPSSSLVAGTVGAITLLMGASGVFGQLKDALNTIWEVKAKPGQGIMKFVRERILSFGMVLVIGFLLLLSLFLTTVLSGISKYVGSALPFSEALTAVIGFSVSFGVITVLFASIFKFLPDAKVKWRDVWIGAIATALLFEIGKILLGLYLGRESTASPYGAAASVVLLLLWVYYGSLILFFGAEFTQVYARTMGEKIEPNANAELVTEEARKQQGLTRDQSALRRSGEQLLEEHAPRKESPHDILGLFTDDRDFPEHSLPDSVVRSNAVSLLFASIGGGFLLGMLMRRKGEGNLSPREHLQEGSRGLALAAGTAAAALAANAFSKTRKMIASTKLKRRGEEFATAATALADSVKRKLG